MELTWQSTPLPVFVTAGGGAATRRLRPRARRLRGRPWQPLASAAAGCLNIWSPGLTRAKRFIRTVRRGSPAALTPAPTGHARPRRTGAAPGHRPPRGPQGRDETMASEYTTEKRFDGECVVIDGWAFDGLAKVCQTEEEAAAY